MWTPLSRLSRGLLLGLCAAALLPTATTATDADKALRVVGAGASFPAPLYHSWFRSYFKKNPAVQFDYQSTGSGGGIENFKGGRLDFAGTDIPLPAEELAAIEGGAIQFPMTAGAIVLAYHLDGVSDLKLSRKAASGIFLGTITHWDDPEIAAHNPGVTLPHDYITVVARADASGTSYFTSRHLAAISPEFAEQVGKSMSPNWPKALKKRGGLIKGHGNGGVAAMVHAIPNSIGYMQYSYAHLTKMPMATLENHAGEYVAPNSESFNAAVAAFKAKLDPMADRRTDPDPHDAYPILELSWWLVRSKYTDPKTGELLQTGQALKDVIAFCLSDGQEASAKLGYIPFGEKGVNKILDKVSTIE